MKTLGTILVAIPLLAFIAMLIYAFRWVGVAVVGGLAMLGLGCVIFDEEKS